MGRDKAEVLWRGEPLWQRQLATLRRSGADEIFVSGRVHGPYAGSGLQIVPDQEPDRGPLGGIATALRHARHAQLLVLAIDLPGITADLLRDIEAESRMHEKAVIPRCARGFEPLAALYTRACLPLMENRLHSGALALQGFADAALTADLALGYELSAETEALFRNVNTPADL